MRSCGRGVGVRRSARYAIASTREAGFDLIEFPVFQPRSLDIEAHPARSSRSTGSDVTCSLGLSFDNDINSSDPAAWPAASSCSTTRSPLHATSARRISEASSTAPSARTRTCRPRRGVATRSRSSAAWRRRAAASDITLGLEFVNRYESNLLNTAAQTMEYIGEVGAPNVVVHLDSYHMNIEESELPRSGVRLAVTGSATSTSARTTVAISARVTSTFPSCSSLSPSTGYDGTITFESFSSAVVDPELSRTLRIWRDVWTDGLDLAKQARRFIGDQIDAARAAHGLTPRTWTASAHGARRHDRPGPRSRARA